MPYIKQMQDFQPLLSNRYAIEYNSYQTNMQEQSRRYKYDDVMGFKENLKDELAFHDMMVKELAVKTGISRRTLDNYLREKPASPTAENAVKIAHVLGVSVEQLVTGKDSAAFVQEKSQQLHLILKESEHLEPNKQQIVLDVISSLKRNIN